ncbi:MAG: hypothetical protein Q3994_03885 [Prevotella sp.]|nr:hypothetical protein [Prevotella sp.]
MKMEKKELLVYEPPFFKVMNVKIESHICSYSFKGETEWADAEEQVGGEGFEDGGSIDPEDIFE